MKKYRVFCGLSTSWKIIVEAESEEEAVREGRRRFIEMVEECDSFFATDVAAVQSEAK